MADTVSDLRKALLTEQERGLLDKFSKTTPDLGETHSEEAAKLKAPGGFRRGFLNAKADAAGIPLANRPPAWRKSLVSSVRPLLNVGYFDRVLGVQVVGGVLLKNVSAGGEASSSATVLAICKAFVGSGVLFMPGAFARAGWAFSSVALVGIALLALTILSMNSFNATGISLGRTLTNMAADSR